jgi:hypothetical protein
VLYSLPDVYPCPKRLIKENALKGRFPSSPRANVQRVSCTEHLIQALPTDSREHVPTPVLVIASDHEFVAAQICTLLFGVPE